MIKEIQTASGVIFKKYVEDIITGNDPKRHKFYKKTVESAEQMGVHIEGFVPDKLLKMKRPNEPKEVRDYRLEIWKAVTKSASDKIVNTVNRIFNPRFFRITFPEKPSIIPENEDLGNFLSSNYGIYRSLWIFVRETLLKLTFSDPNAVCVVAPKNLGAEGSEFYEPLPLIYRAESVVDFVDDEYFTVFVPQKNGIKEKRSAGTLMIVDRYSIRVWAVTNSEVKLTLDFQHNLGVVPAFRLGGQIEGDKSPYYFSSFVQGIQPHWDKAITMISDLDGSIVNHLFPERYEWQDTCGTCKGDGNITLTAGGKDRTVGCQSCSGTGWVTNKSPYGVISIKRDALTPEIQAPIPPADYITKDIEPIRELKTLIDDEMLKGYSAINMEILHKVGENQSGLAKTIDRQDLDSFLMRISNHVFDYQVRNIIDITARWRMSNILSELAMDDYVKGVTISKPKEFNVLSTEMLVQELQSATNVSSNYYKHIETELINNKFSNNESERKKNLAIVKLKPFPNKTIDQLMSARAINAIKEIDVIRNENIDELVDVAMAENSGFLDLDFVKQLEVINAIIKKSYLDEVIPLISPEPE